MFLYQCLLATNDKHEGVAVRAVASAAALLWYEVAYAIDNDRVAWYSLHLSDVLDAVAIHQHVASLYVGTQPMELSYTVALDYMSVDICRHRVDGENIGADDEHYHYCHQKRHQCLECLFQKRDAVLCKYFTSQPNNLITA